MYKAKKDTLKRYFHVELTDEDTDKTIEISVNSPKIKFVRQFEKMDDSSAFEDIILILSKVLSSNKEKIKVTPEFLESALDTDELVALMDDWTSWIGGVKANDPN